MEGAGAVSSEEIGNVEKLRDITSFDIWKFQVTVLLKSSGLMNIVEGEEAFVETMEEKTKKLWIKNDAKAQRILIGTIDKKVFMHVINCKTSAEMYKKLCLLFKKDTEQQKCNLLQEFLNYTFERGSDMSLHISKLENLAYRLNAMDQEIDETMLISKILSSLPDRFNYFRAAWESLQKVKKLLSI